VDPAELQRFVDEDDVEGLVDAVSLEEIADAWWRYTLRERGPEAKGYDEPDW
jgi:hypothetical protein